MLYSSRSKIVSHGTFSEARGYRDDEGGNSSKTSHRSKDIPDTGFQGLGIANNLIVYSGVAVEGRHAETIDKEVCKRCRPRI